LHTANSQRDFRPDLLRFSLRNIFLVLVLCNFHHFLFILFFTFLVSVFKDLFISVFI